MEKKTNISASIPIGLYQWLKDKEINISETVEKFLSEMKVNDESPMEKIKKITKEMDRLTEEREFYCIKIQNVVEEGNRKEREEAKAIQEEIERKEKDLIKRNISLIEELQKHDLWEEFVDNYEGLTVEQIVDYNEKFTDSGIKTKGWGNLREIMKLFTKEQLKGSVVLLEKENVTNAEAEGQD